jgi:hypothetical protein
VGIRGWRIWYADGSAFDSAMGAWEDAPDRGVQVVMVYYDPPGRRVICGEDAYERPGRRRWQRRCVKHGSLMASEAEFEAIHSRALEAPPP